MKKNLLLWTGIFLSGVGFAAAGFSLIPVIKNQSLTNKKVITLTDISPEAAGEVSKKLVYSSSETGSKDYYSPELDILFHYSPNKYRLSDSFKVVDLSLVSFFDFEQGGSIGLIEAGKVSGTIVKYFENKYVKSYPDTKIVEQTDEGELSLTRLDYSTENPVLKGKRKNQHRLIYSKKLTGKYLYIDFFYEGNFNIEKVKDDLKQLLKTAEFSPQNIEQFITLELTNPGVKFRVDRKKWGIDSQNSLSLFLRYRFSGLETEGKSIELGNYPSATLGISTIEAYKPVDEAFLKNQISESIAVKKSVLKDFKVISKDEKEEIGGYTFRKYSYFYKSLGDPTYAVKYFGFNQNTGYQIEIDFSSHSLGNSGVIDFKEILKTFELGGNNKISNKGKSNAKILGTSSIQVEKASLIGINSVVHIFNRTCVNVEVKSDPDLIRSGEKTYEICMAGTGSGFYVNKNGYIITNAHVAQPNPLDVILENVLSDPHPKGFWLDFATDIGDILVQQGKIVDDREFVGIVLQTAIGLIDKGLITLKPVYENFVEKDEPFAVTNYNTFILDNSAGQSKAMLIDAVKIESLFKISIAAASGEKAGITKPDIALLKVDGEQFPGLAVADFEMVAVGQLIQAIGFPGAAQNNQLFSVGASIIPTLTKGTISAIKPSYDGSFKLVQVDASIAPGNSGGPIVNEDSEVIGISTYGLNIGGEGGAADFNAGISSEAVVGFLQRNNVQNDVGEVGGLIKSGADYLGKHYYKWAVRDFEKAVSFYPQANSTIAPFWKIAKAKIEKGEDKTPLIKVGSLELSTTSVGLLGGGILFLIGGIVFVILFVSKKSKNNQPPQNGNPQNFSGQTYNPPPAEVIPPVLPTADSQTISQLLPPLPPIPISQ